MLVYDFDKDDNIKFKNKSNNRHHSCNASFDLSKLVKKPMNICEESSGLSWTSDDDSYKTRSNIIDRSADSPSYEARSPNYSFIAGMTSVYEESYENLKSSNKSLKQSDSEEFPPVDYQKNYMTDDFSTQLNYIQYRHEEPDDLLSSYLFVVAIDFGTTYSGYAFALTRQSNSIHMMRNWEGGDPGVVNQKTPTTILLTPNEEFHSFGYYARDFFHDLDSSQSREWLYFEKFKMHLHHTQELTMNTVLTASNGKKVNALKIFTYALAYFKNYAMKELNEQTGSKIIDEDIKWVITVPAIWRQPAKAFMRHAAYMAGIANFEKPEQLLIALEPEAASIYIRKLRANQLLYLDLSYEDTNGILSSCKQVVRYMVVDCGGGTVDITVHELNGCLGTLKELYKATGGPYGSTAVDNEFENLLISIFSREFMEAFKMKRPSGFVDLMIGFEARKRTANLLKPNSLNISLPFCFVDFYKRFKGQTVESALKKFNSSQCRWSSQGMLRISMEIIYSLFKPVLNKIKEAISEVLTLPSVGPMNYMFLVGGFAESTILQQELKTAFSQSMKIVIAQDVSLAILKGAVLYGLNPTVVNVRRSRLTYGVGIMHRFKPRKHPSEKLVIKDGQEWCADIFDKFVLVDQSVGIGDIVLRRYTPAGTNQQKSIIHFYCSESDEAKYVSDQGVHRIGTLILDFPLPADARKEDHREIQTRMVFGDTEIKVSALDVFTGKCVKAIIDFLNN